MLDDPAVDDGDAYSNTRVFTVAPGVYTVRRNNPSTWFTTAIVCTPDSNATVNVAQRLAVITVASDAAVTCTFTVDRAVTIRARVFNDLVRRNTNLGKRNLGDPWLEGWTVSVFTAPTALVTSSQTSATTISDLYEAQFSDLRSGSYTVCITLPTNTWSLSSPAEPDQTYNKPCKVVMLTPGQASFLFFGVYDAPVAARTDVTAADELIMEEERITALPYDPAEDETGSDDANAPRLFLPLVHR